MTWNEIAPGRESSFSRRVLTWTALMNYQQVTGVHLTRYEVGLLFELDNLQPKAYAADIDD